MKELEDALRNLPKPDIRVPRFQQSLRRELLSLRHERASRIYKWAFACTGVAALSMAVMLAVFVLKPEVPASLNRMALGQTERAAPTALAEQAPVRREMRPIPVGTPFQPPAGARPVRNDPYLNTLLSEARSPEEADRNLVRYWYEQEYSAAPARVKPVGESGLYTIRQYELDSGRKVYVYTELVDEESPEVTGY